MSEIFPIKSFGGRKAQSCLHGRPLRSCGACWEISQNMSEKCRWEILNPSKSMTDHGYKTLVRFGCLDRKHILKLKGKIDASGYCHYCGKQIEEVKDD